MHCGTITDARIFPLRICISQPLAASNCICFSSRFQCICRGPLPGLTAKSLPCSGWEAHGPRKWTNLPLYIQKGFWNSPFERIKTQDSYFDVAKWSWKWIGPDWTRLKQIETDWNRLKQIEMDNGWKWRLCPGMLVWLSFNLFARSRQNMLGHRCRSIPSQKILPSGCYIYILSGTVTILVKVDTWITLHRLSLCLSQNVPQLWCIVTLLSHVTVWQVICNHPIINICLFCQGLSQHVAALACSSGSNFEERTTSWQTGKAQG